MARICILTGEPVLYLDCQECDYKSECRNGHLQKKESASSGDDPPKRRM